MQKSLLLTLTVFMLLFLSPSVGRSLQAHEREPESCPIYEQKATDFKNHKLFSPAVTTWSPAEITCPVCKTKNVFLQVMSYGNYIYQWPSKYQLIYWPYTDSPAWYSCKKCRLTTFMGDFDSVPKEKIPELLEMLKGVSLPAQKERGSKESMDHPPYVEISSSARLLVAEKVYRTLGRTDDKFWAHFYRVMAYHFDGENKQSEADDARRKALAIIERSIADKAQLGTRKEALYVSGALRHYLRDDTGALRDFEQAKMLTYNKNENKPEDNKGYNDYLSNLIDSYIEMIQKSEGPRTKKSGGNH